MRILMVGGGRELQNRLRELDPGIRTAALCRASGLDLIRGIDVNEATIVLPDRADAAAWARAAQQLHAVWPVDRVVALAEIDQDKAADVAVALGLPYHSPETVALATDKVRMRRRLAEAGVDDLPAIELSGVEELAEFHRRVGSVIVKPAAGRGSAGVAEVHAPADVAAAYAHALAGANDTGLGGACLQQSSPMAERLLVGPEFSVEAFTVDGQHHVFAITEKFLDARTKVELGHVIPARIPAGTAARIVAYVDKILTALDVRFGITHTEVILDHGDPVIVETHLRKAGGEIIAVVRSATTVDMDDLTVRQAAGQDLADEPELKARCDGPRYEAAGAILYLAPDLTGELLGVDGGEDVAALPGVVEYRQLLPDGARLTGLTSSLARVARVRVEGATAEEALNRGRQALAALRVRVACHPAVDHFN